MTPDLIIELGACVFALVIWGGILRSAYSKPDLKANALRDLVLQELGEMRLTDNEREAVDLYAWATKSGWSYVASVLPGLTDRFPIFRKRLP